MEGVIGLWKQVTPTLATTLFSLPFLSASGKIKTKWMAALWAQDEREIKSVSEKREKGEYAEEYPDDFSDVWGGFGSCGVLADRLPCEMIRQQLALVLSWRGSVL